MSQNSVVHLATTLRVAAVQCRHAVLALVKGGLGLLLVPKASSCLDMPEVSQLPPLHTPGMRPVLPAGHSC